MSVISLEDEAIILLSRQYIAIVRRLIVEIGLPTDNYSISKSSMELAFSEAAKDIEIMSIRRQPKRGISCSKIAGIIAFRLARFSPIHLSGKALNDEKSLKLNELSALALAFKCILHIDLFDGSLTNHATTELQYSMVRRHMNQETLGMVFEVLDGFDRENKS